MRCKIFAPLSRYAAKSVATRSKICPMRQIRESTGNALPVLPAYFDRFFLAWGVGYIAIKCASKMYTGLGIDAVLKS